MSADPTDNPGLAARAGRWSAAPENNEAAAAMQLIELLQLKGCVVTADALHCHRTMAKAIVERGGDYVLTVKANQPALMADAEAAVAALKHKSEKSAKSAETAHGRREKRAALVAAVEKTTRKPARRRTEPA